MQENSLQNHPQSSILQSQSEVTIKNFKSQWIEQGQIQQMLKRYSMQDRRHLIVNRSSGEIIDSRNQEVIQNFPMGRNQIKQYKSQYINSQGNLLKNPWSQHWLSHDKMHEQLLQAICKNDLEKCQRILKKKQQFIPININYKSFDKWCPIHYAANHGSVQLMKLLLQNIQLRINSKTNFGWNALHIAVNSNKGDICFLLIDRGININQQDNELNTPLHYATELKYKDIVEMLIEQGADLTLKNNKNFTPKNLCMSNDLLKLFQTQSNEQQDSNNLISFLKNKRIQYVEKMISGQKQTCVKKQQVKKQQVNKKKQKINLSRKNNIIKMYTLLKQNKPQQSVTLSSFKFYKKIGQGAFGQVYVVKKGKGQKLYALKAIKKEKVLKTNLYKYIQTQKQVLSLISHPFIVRLHYAFQTQQYLFLVMEYCQGGDLGRVLSIKKKLDQATVKAYGCEVLLAIQALHKNKIIYRDLKPQNIVIDKDGHALLTDFGLSKKTKNLDDINKSFCGTPAYLPLQIIDKKGHTRMADWYQYGIVLYEMLIGIPPFYADTRTQLYENVRNGIIKFPKSTPRLFRDLIRKLLTQNYQDRLGFQKDADSIKQHPWFSDIDWDDVVQRKLKVPPLTKKIIINQQPIKCKFQDIKSQKFQIPSWSFIAP